MGQGPSNSDPHFQGADRKKEIEFNKKWKQWVEQQDQRNQQQQDNNKKK